MPPQPSDLASAAPHRLRARSSRSATIAVYFSRIHSTTCASGIAVNIAENAAASQGRFRCSIVERALTAGAEDTPSVKQVFMIEPTPDGQFKFYAEGDEQRTDEAL